MSQKRSLVMFKLKCILILSISLHTVLGFRTLPPRYGECTSFYRKDYTCGVYRFSEKKARLISPLEATKMAPSPERTNKFEVLAILGVYFVQGVVGLARLATSFFLKDELHLSPADMSIFAGLAGLPWIIKPLYGFLSDGFPLFGYRRRSYLILSGIFGFLSWLALGTIVDNFTTAIFATLLGSASVAFSDVVVDSIVVEKSRPSFTSLEEKNVEGGFTGGGGEGNEVGEEIKTLSKISNNVNIAGDLQSLCWGSAALGGIISAYFSGSLLQTVTPRTVFLITSIFPLLIGISAFFVNEKQATYDLKEGNGINLKAQLLELKNTLLNPRIYLPVLFIFFWQATPTPDSAMFYFNTNELGFQPEFLGKVRFAASFASLLGVTLYRFYLKDLPIKTVILWCALLSVPLGLSPLLLTSHVNRELGIPDQTFALTDTIVLTVLGQIAFMPTLALAASLCPPGVEGTLFAALMSIYNFSGTVSSEIGAGLTYLLGITDSNFDNLSLLVLICGLTSLLPIPFINLLDKAAVVERKEE